MDIIDKKFNNHTMQLIIKAVKRFAHNDGMASAGNMAFLAMLSIFPFVISLISLSGYFGQTERGLEGIQFAFSILPSEVSSVLSGPIQGVIKNTRGDILTFSFLIAIWVSANGVEASRHSIIKAFGKEHTHAAWKRRLESLIVVICAAILVISSMSILVIGPAIIKAITSLFPDIITGQVNALWAILRLFISPALLLAGLYGVFFALTPRSVIKPVRFPGAVLTLIFLLATGKGLSVYLQYAGSYDVTYGSLAGVVITQLFCFIVSIGFILGANLNAVWTEQKSNSNSNPKIL